MREYAEELIESGETEISRDDLASTLRDLFANYASANGNIDTIFKEMGYDIKYNWTVSMPKFELRPGDEVISLIDSHNSRNQELILFGHQNISEEASQYLFYKIGGVYFGQVNLYIEYINVFQVIGKQMVTVFLIDILLMLLFLAAMIYSMKTFMMQRRILNLQTDFINAVSHEFNTPLSSIRIGGQALLKIKAVSNQNMLEEFAGGILRQQKHLQNLVDQILTIGVSENPNFILDENWRCAKDIVTEDVKIWLDGQNIKDVSILIGELPKGDIKVDLQLFRLVLNNLFDNARKYGGDLPVEIKLWGEIREKEYRIVIADKGRGISEIDLKLVFKKFQRGQDNGGDKQKGLGLGLYLVDRIMKLHNGSVEIKSKIGEETQIALILPVHHEG